MVGCTPALASAQLAIPTPNFTTRRTQSRHGNPDPNRQTSKTAAPPLSANPVMAAKAAIHDFLTPPNVIMNRANARPGDPARM
jgi:hypothetical protein